MLRRIAWLAALVLVMSACGDEPPRARQPEAVTGKAFVALPAQRIVEAAVDDMWRVKGYVVSADLRVNGSKSTLAARVGAGGDCDAKVTLGAARQEYRQIGDLVYVMANRAYWTDSLGERDGRAVAKEAKGRWLRRSGPSARQSFCEGNYASPALISGARYSKGTPTKLDGQQVVPVTITLRDLSVTVWVRTGKRHYLVKMRTKGGSQPGTISLSDFDKEQVVQVPDPKQVVDGQDLGLA